MATNDQEIEKLVVTLEANYKDFLAQIDRAVDEAVKKLKEVDEAPKKQKTHWEQLAGFLKGQFMQVITGVGAAIAAAFSVQVVASFFAAIASGMVSVNKQFESFEAQFTTLLGSSQAAKRRVAELAEFGVKTPFQLDEIIQADRLLQTFGGDVLARGDELRRVGDAAAGAQTSFKELSFWWGRLYDAIQSGAPMGEALMRMQELGLVSGSLRKELEGMRESGADVNEIWKVFTENIDQRFAGAMEKQSKTLEGLISNIEDWKQALAREGGETLFEGVREDAQEFYDIISDPKAGEAITDVAKALGLIFDSLRQTVTSPLLEQIKEIDPDRAESLAASMTELSSAIDNISGQKITNLGDLVTMADTAASTAASLLQTLNILKEISFTLSGFTAISGGMEALGENGNQLKEAVLGAVFPLKGLSDAVETLTGSDLNSWLGATEKSLNEVATAGQNAFDKLQEGARKATEMAEVPDQTPLDDPEAREAYLKSVQELRDLQAEVAEKKEEAEAEHNERVLEINEDYQERVTELEQDTAQRREEIVKDSAEELAELERDGAEERIEIAEDTAEALADLAKESASRRADAEEKARESLADLEEDAQNEVAEVQEEAQERERRELEDHQREMARLRQDYLLNLEDAVTARDARAIVNLRRQYQAERQEREQDFETQRTRTREESEKRVEEARETARKRKEEIQEQLEEELRDIQENEEEKKREILSAQEERLQEQAEKEAERKAQIEADQAEELARLEEQEAEKRAKLDESLAEQLAKEEEHHAESLAALDETLQQWQEKTAEAWAEIEGLTDAGAQAAFEAMAGVFGPGGSADAMWDSYFERLQQKAADMATFNQRLGAQSAQGLEGSPPPLGQGGTTSEAAGGAGIPSFAQGGIVPGQPGKKRLILAHAGELIVPPDQTSQWMAQQGQMMAQNLDNSAKVVELKVSGSAPPGIGGGEIEQIAGTLVQALNEAGIRARRR